MKLRTDFSGGGFIEPGDYDFIIENPEYREVEKDFSFYARATGGDSDGMGLFDSFLTDYGANEKVNKKWEIPFGIQKTAALLASTGLGQSDFKDNDEVKAYYKSLWERLKNPQSIKALMKKIDGALFHGTVEPRRNDPNKMNIVKYDPVEKKQAKQPQSGLQSGEEESW